MNKKPVLPTKEILLVLRHPQVIPYIWSRQQVVKRIVKAETLRSQSEWVTKVRQARTLAELVKLSNVHWTFQQALLYFVTRFKKPNVVVETGVNYGTSSALILQALEDNGVGVLYSIDLPSVTYEAPFKRDYKDLQLPKGTSTGFAVPPRPRHRWRLIIGDAKVELPKLLNAIGKIDMFYHDSMHTYDFMTFEYETAYPFIRSGGILASDDIHWNTAFDDFCSSHRLEELRFYAKGFATVP